jgi:hypothetical protein
MADQEVTGNVQQGQPAVAGVAQATPAQPPVDAPKMVPQTDIDALKSSLQRQQYEQQRYYLEQLEAAKREIEARDAELYREKTADMEPEAKRQYDMQLAIQARDAKMQELEQRLRETEADRVAAQNRENAIDDVATRLGIPREKIEQYADSPDNLRQFETWFVGQLRSRAFAAPPAAPKVTSTVPGGKSGGLLKELQEAQAKGDFKTVNQILERGRRSGYSQSDL